MSQCCGAQWEETKKWPGEGCFSCLGDSCALMLEPGHVYPKCSPLVEGENKNAPLQPMTSADQCIRAFVGPKCDIDATEWTEACWQHVYPEATAYKNRICWPSDETGESIFTVEDIDMIVQGHSGLIKFDEIQENEPARDWLKQIDSSNQGKVA